MASVALVVHRLRPEALRVAQEAATWLRARDHAQARPADLAFDRFTTEFAKRYGIPYGPKLRDSAQLKVLRGQLGIAALAASKADSCLRPERHGSYARPEQSARDQ